MVDLLARSTSQEVDTVRAEPLEPRVKHEVVTARGAGAAYAQDEMNGKCFVAEDAARYSRQGYILYLFQHRLPPSKTLPPGHRRIGALDDAHQNLRMDVARGDSAGMCRDPADKGLLSLYFLSKDSHSRTGSGVPSPQHSAKCGGSAQSGIGGEE